MSYPFVIVRTAGGRPVKRIVVGGTQTHIFIANPESIRAVESGESGPIGFPKSDVFMYEEQSLSDLEDQWINYHKTEDDTWNRLIPFNG